VVACNRAIGNFLGAISCVGAGSSTRLGDNFSSLALALMRAISRSISSASTSSSSSLSIPRSSRDVFQDASPVDHRLSRAFDGESRIGRVGRGGEREVVNMEEREGPASSAGGVGSRLRPYVFRTGFGGSGTSVKSDFSGYDEGKAVSDDVDMVVVRSRRRVTVCLMSVL
jgi:hypothetical protein